MDDFANKSPEERMVFIQQAALKTNLTETIIEKDFWVCWLLQKIFSLPVISEHLIFKGGTSLSKAYGLLRRFSEDIDISIDRALIGFAGDKDPLATTSRTARERRLEALQAACVKTISLQVLPALETLISRDLMGKGSLSIDPEDPFAVLFHFPSAFGSGVFSYITPYVKLEFGARADLWPQEERQVVSYLAEQLPNQFEQTKSEPIKVLSAERTFWEKVTILHAEYHRPESKGFPERLSRHFYDLHILMLHPLGAKAAQNLELLERVVNHKQVFFRSGWANYDRATPGGLRLLPTAAQETVLRLDYARMRDMFFDEPPSFDEILISLKKLEDQLNKGM